MPVVGARYNLIGPSKLRKSGRRSSFAVRVRSSDRSHRTEVACRLDLASLCARASLNERERESSRMGTRSEERSNRGRVDGRGRNVEAGPLCGTYRGLMWGCCTPGWLTKLRSHRCPCWTKNCGSAELELVAVRVSSRCTGVAQNGSNHHPRGILTWPRAC